MNTKFLMSCAAIGLAGLGGLAASPEAQARTSDVGLVGEAHDAVIATSASSLRPDLLIVPGEIGGITLTERGLVRNVKVAEEYKE
jgi:hypothetical protein